ncbi:MAG: SAF domain-containing protein [Chloroflexota bacterium]
MRRGRIFIYLALVIIIAVVAGWFYLRSRQNATLQQAAGNQATPVERYVQIVSAGQNIAQGSLITETMLSSYQLPENSLVEGLFTDKSLVVDRYAKMAIPQGVPITASGISDTPGNVNLLGSSWASYVPQGLTAVAIPITRLSSAAFGIRDGDYVDVIVTMLVVDVDPAYQSVLPDYTAGVSSFGTDQQLSLTAQIASGGEVSRAGRAELDSTLNLPLYLVPSEAQRPRLVTQMIMQNIQVLHVGTFPLPGESTSDQTMAVTSAEPTATPDAAQQTVSVTRPDIITVMVTPQDAVMLTYLIYSGAEINLTLRNPADQELNSQPDAATLEYLLTQYNIPVPAKLPYALQPRLDNLQKPQLPNDTTSVP